MTGTVKESPFYKIDNKLNGLQIFLTSLHSCFGRFKLRLKVSCNSKRVSGNRRGF